MKTLHKQTAKQIKLERFPASFANKKNYTQAIKFESPESRTLILKALNQYSHKEKITILSVQNQSDRRENTAKYLSSLSNPQIDKLFESLYNKVHAQFELLEQRDELLRYYEQPYADAVKKQKEKRGTKRSQKIITVFEDAYQARLDLLKHSTQKDENNLDVLPLNKFIALTNSLMSAATKAQRIKHYPFTNKEQKNTHNQIQDVISGINPERLTDKLKLLYANPYLNAKISARDTTETINTKQAISLDKLIALKAITTIDLPDPLHDSINKTGDPLKDRFIDDTCNRLVTRSYLLEYCGPYDTDIINGLKKYIETNYKAISNPENLTPEYRTIPNLRPEITNEELFGIAKHSLPLENFGYLTYADITKHDPDPRTYLIDSLSKLKELPKDLTHYKRDLLGNNEIRDYTYLTAQLSNIIDNDQWKKDYRNPLRDDREFESGNILEELASDTLFEIENHNEITRELDDPQRIELLTYEKIQEKLYNKTQIEHRIEDTIDIFEDNNFELRQAQGKPKLNTFFYTNPRMANISELIVRAEIENMNNLLTDRYFPNPDKLIWVHGAQDYDHKHIHETLDELYPNKNGLAFIHCGLPGAVTAADTWLIQNKLQHIVVRPDWNDPSKRKSAPFRNIEEIARGFYHNTLDRHLQPDELVLFTDPDKTQQNGLIVRAGDFAEENGIDIIERYTKPIELSIDKSNPDIIDKAMLSGMNNETLDEYDYEY